jgi:hypothetical protein
LPFDGIFTFTKSPMQRILAHIIILIYLTGIAAPLFPIVEYAIEKDYISEILCINRDKPEMKCDGKCYLSQKLSQARSSDQDGSETDRQIVMDKKIYCCDWGLTGSAPDLENHSEMAACLNNLADQAFPESPFRPPQLS